jgi:phenylalanyl-tRNA synthetase beta chain
MKASLSWIKDFVVLPENASVEQLTSRLTALGLKLEALHGGEITGPVVVGRVLNLVKETQKNGKSINWCRVDVGPEHNDPDFTDETLGGGPSRGIICGAHNFEVGDLVVASLPGAVLPGNFEIAARKTYGHVSDGMICSSRELALGDDYEGIIVLPPDSARPGDNALAILGLLDTVIEFEINPDRAYALSVRGIAREAALAYDAPFRDPAAVVFPPANSDGYPVRIEDVEGCPVFVARTVTGLNPQAPTPSFIASRVKAAGMRSISLAVDVTNYVMLELGQPIHAYDSAKLDGAIVVRRAVAGEKLTTLDGVERELDPTDLLITDDSGAIGLAGVMGGATTEISETTTEIVIEAAHFEPSTIFRTQRRHKLPSEASKRFERGVDPLLPPVAAQRVAELLVEYGGGRLEEGVTHAGEFPPPATLTMALDLPRRITGMAIADDDVLAHLKAVGCGVQVEDDNVVATIPTWRPDISQPYDLVEEVARIVGYDMVPSVLPSAPPGRGLTRAQQLRRRVGFAMAGAGFVEVKSYPFVGQGDFDRLGIAPDDPRRRTVMIANPLSAERPSLTTSLLPMLLETAARNVSRGRSDLALFEIAPGFFPARETLKAPIFGVERRPTDEELAELFAAIPRQPRLLAGVLCGERDAAGWWGSGRAVSWADAIEVVRQVASTLGVTVDVAAAEYAPWHPGRCAVILVNGRRIGHAGELHPRVVREYGLPPRTAALQLVLDILIAEAEKPQAPGFSIQPQAKEDVALVVDADVTAESVSQALVAGAGDLLESVRLFDVYTGSQVGEGKKSLAFALRFRAADRTLTEAETAAARDAAVAMAAEHTGAVQRA